MTFSKTPLKPSKSDMAFETLVSETDLDETLAVGPSRDSEMSFPPPPPGQAQRLAIIWADGTPKSLNPCV